MASSRSAQSSVGVGASTSTEPTVVRIKSTTRNKDLFQHFDLCEMSNGADKAPRKGCEAEERKGCSYKTFMACKPKDFEERDRAVGAIRWLEDMESVLDINDCKEDNKVKYATHSLKGAALTWWNTVVKTRGRNAIKVMNWKAFKDLVTEKFCPINELERIEAEFLAHEMIGLDHTKYINRFNELALLVPHLVTPETKRIGRYIWGLAPQIRGYVRTARPSTFQSAVELGGTLTDEIVRCGRINQERAGDKRKWQDNRNERKGDQKFRKFESKGNDFGRAKTATTPIPGRKIYLGTSSWCDKCKIHHQGECNPKYCYKCKKAGHLLKDCRVKDVARCYECGDTGHLRNVCPKLKRDKPQKATGIAFVLTATEAQKDPEMITGTFLLNNHVASVLIDTGATFSFISTKFRSLLDKQSTCLKDICEVEIATGKVISIKEMLKDCELVMEGQKFKIDLLRIELGGFDVVIGMDWLAMNKVELNCEHKIITIPLTNDKKMVVIGHKVRELPHIISYAKTEKYSRKGNITYLAYVITKKEDAVPKEIPIVSEYLDVFPEELPGVPPPRQVEFRIDLIPGAAPVAKAPYRLAPFEMQEMVIQILELMDKGFIRPSFSPWGAQYYL
ncbi:hypothetical protein E3N88_18319 [Mikania micrantha]|uniref:CCHC-type domain-containing protein n=1 Tax=Mikania micrantha TaxID=192012 RepID=A0A5N6NW65_9ASTR|nr:hypothetical protein E3N88_18319 [Mikania micrantha]